MCIFVQTPTDIACQLNDDFDLRLCKYQVEISLHLNNNTIIVTYSSIESTTFITYTETINNIYDNEIIFTTFSSVVEISTLVTV